MRWLLEVTATAAPADPAVFEEQWQLLCFVARFYSVSRIWRAYVGVLDVRALRVLQCLYEAAQRFGTEVRVQAIAAPDTWKGPCFSDSEELADLVTARADHGRLLGQPPLLT
ncbi:hypothetical protein ACFVYV_51185 [Streptomyces mirabilis]|uniref:hypothetical protein n=1 Tax=Streptomyces mirabilis TaxID=68239 RepID=UPI000EB1A05E